MNGLWELLKHALINFAVASVILILAGLLSYGELMAERLNLPGYVQFGARTIAVFLFIIDGVVLIGTSAILAIKTLRAQIKA